MSTSTAPTDLSQERKPPTPSSFQASDSVQARVNPLYTLSQSGVYHVVSAHGGHTRIIEGDIDKACPPSRWSAFHHASQHDGSDSSPKRKSPAPNGSSPVSDTPLPRPASAISSTFLDRISPKRFSHSSRSSSQAKLAPGLRPPSLPPSPPLSRTHSEADASEFETADEDEAQSGYATTRQTTLNSNDIELATVVKPLPDLPSPIQLPATDPVDTACTSEPEQISEGVSAEEKIDTAEPVQPTNYLQLPSTSRHPTRAERPTAPSNVSFSSTVSGFSGRPTLRKSSSAQGLAINILATPQNAVASSSKASLASATPASPASADRIGSRVKSKSPARQLSLPSASEEIAADVAVADGFQDEIARHAEEIRKERSARKLEKERQQQQQQPQYKRDRSASKGGEEGSRERKLEGWHQPQPPGGLLQRAGTMIEDKPLIGNLIGEDHVNYVLMYNMLTGIRIGVSRCQAKPRRHLTEDDYTAKHKFSFDIIGNELTPSVQYDFKFKDYAPWIFRDLREHFLLDPADYLLSLTAKYILSELGSPGKSGSFFYFSRDYRFIIKTIRHSEHKFLRRILKQYHNHVLSNPHTLISRFYGLHRVKLPRGRKIHFVIMNNLMPPHRDVHETYDLKGSTVKRVYPEDKALLNPHATLKDLNWLRREKRLCLGPEKRALFAEQLKSDTAFLKELGVMDYSLLVGFHDLSRGNKDKLREGALSMFNPETSPKLKRRQTQVTHEREQDPTALRMAVERSDPKTLADMNWLPDKDRSERQHFIFYQDEGGLQATDQLDMPLSTVYYLGIIDILTPWSCKKFFENMVKGFTNDRHAISPVPPNEYGNRFQKFILGITEAPRDSQMVEKSRGEKALNEKGKAKAINEKAKLD